MKTEDIRLIVIGTEQQAQAVLRDDRPDLGREHVLVLSEVKDAERLRGRQFRECTAVRYMGDPKLDVLVEVARSRRVLPPVLPKRERGELTGEADA